MALQSYTPETQEKNSVKVYIPVLLDELGIDPRAYSQRREKRPIEELRYNKMLELLQPFDDVVGMLPDRSFYRFLTFGGYNPDDETMEIVSPFLFELARRYDNRRYTFLMHSDVANEPNQAAVEVAVALLRGLVKRGTTHPDARGIPGLIPAKKKKTTKTASGDTITEETIYREPQQLSLFTEQNQQPQATFSYEISYGSIVEKCPELQKALADIAATEKRTMPDGTEKGPVKKKPQAINTKLKQVFTAAFRILLEKTDAPQYYKNLHFTNKHADGSYILPTSSTLYTKKICLVHNGRNRDYKSS